MHQPKPKLSELDERTLQSLSRRPHRGKQLSSVQKQSLNRLVKYGLAYISQGTVVTPPDGREWTISSAGNDWLRSRDSATATITLPVVGRHIRFATPNGPRRNPVVRATGKLVTGCGTVELQARGTGLVASAVFEWTGWVGMEFANPAAALQAASVRVDTIHGVPRADFVSAARVICDTFKLPPSKICIRGAIRDSH